MTKKPTATISKLSFSGGQVVELDPTAKVVIVGPNNSGKSQALRDIDFCIGRNNGVGAKVVTEVELSKRGSYDELIAFLDENAEYRALDNVYWLGGWAVHKSHLQGWKGQGLANIHSGFTKRISADERLKICEPQTSISPGAQKSRPQHVLYDDQDLMTKISGLFRAAFGQDLMFDYRGGNVMPIHVGPLPDMKEMPDRVGEKYVAAVRENPVLNEQGDGMKSYAGLLFECVVGHHDIALIDEPEAFLHPPQMRRLGKTLCEQVDGQLVVATHSSDIMRGFLEGAKGVVRILRIRRVGDVNQVFEAPSDTIKQLWEKPDLKYSNALEGIFHEQTILCEDDSDCRLINATADHLSAQSDDLWKDTAYVPTGGKHAIAKIATVLRMVGVPLKAVFDIDFLDDKQVVRSSVTAFGGDWRAIEPLWQRVDGAVRNGVKPKTVDEIKVEISDLLKESEPNALPAGDIKEALKQTKPWSIVKKTGVNGIPPGEATKHYNALIQQLAEIGIYVIPVGEIENFCREIGGHGPKFVTTVLSDIPLDDARLGRLRAFTETVHKGAHCVLP